MINNPYYQDEQITLCHGDSVAVLRDLPDESIDCCVTSPPYYGLRDYGEPGQMGLEESPADYIEKMRQLFSEIRRALKSDGTLWVNLGDSYSQTRTSSGTPAVSKTLGLRADGTDALGDAGRARAQQRQRMGQARTLSPGLPAKNLLGIPWRVALALQDDGWILRNDIIWSKPNAMPESVTDRLSMRHEHVFLFAKSPRYWFDLDSIREAYTGDRDLQRRARSGDTNKANSVKAAWPPVGGVKQQGLTSTRSGNVAEPAAGRNPGDVWELPTQPFAEAHFAVMPLALAERCVLAGCKPGGVVLDPFSGSGTTGLAATKHGRKYLGIDLSADYLELSLRTRLAQGSLGFEETA